MISVKNSYEIAYNGTENECRFDLYADTTADLQGLTHIDGIKIQMGSECTDIATGDKYLLNGSGAWILQPSDNAWQNVYTKPEIDSMITEIYDIIAYYHTTLVSDTGEITFYALAGYIATWKIYGNGQQTGTPTPDNPVMPEFVGVRTGQFLDIKDGTQTINNVVWTAYHGTITAQGTTTSISESDTIIVYDGTFTKSGNYINYCKIQSSKSIKPPAGTYTFSANANPSSPNNIALIVGDHGAYFSNSSARKITVGETFSVNGNEYVMLVVSSNTSLSQYDFADIMLNIGSTALPYEPYGWKIPITCAGQTTPVYLGQTPTVRRIRKLVLTGTEEIYSASTDSNRTVCRLPLLECSGNFGFCTHIEWKSPYQDTEYDRLVWNDSSGGSLYISLSNIYLTSQTVQGMKAYFAAQYAAGHPVTIWYVLATSTTGIVNEPLCKIGDYADELHSTDAGVTIPTVKGQNTLTVDTELQPSLIEISGGYHA